MLSTEHDDGGGDRELPEPQLGDSGHVPLPPTERFVLGCRFECFFMLPDIPVIFLMLPDAS